MRGRRRGSYDGNIKLNGALTSFKYCIWIGEVSTFFEPFTAMVMVSLPVCSVVFTSVGNSRTLLVGCNCLELRIDTKNTYYESIFWLIFKKNNLG
jgi:hypothetical protein